MTKLAFYVMNEPKHDEAKSQLSFKGRISLPKKNENDAPRGLIFDVLVTNADDLTVSMLGL
ncbi:hypothetical protein, partial [Vibrio vulnificus]|uniref:hypothetical protein n=1 Tax=Vibrio vulnificus TaxID=672 RepID=UPI0039B5D680